MLIVTIEREKPAADGSRYGDKREVFRYEAADLDIPAIIRATLDADIFQKREQEEARRILEGMREIEFGQYCVEGCERTAARVAAAAMRGEPTPVCTKHKDDVPF